MGPVEYLVVEFPGNHFKGEIVPALADLIEKGTIRIIDLLFVKKDEEENVTAFELSDLTDEEAAPYDKLEGEINDLLNEEDIEMAAAMLQPNSSAAILVFEHVWATELRDAILNADGRLLENGRIAPAVVNAALEAAAGALA